MKINEDKVSPLFHLISTVISYHIWLLSKNKF